MNSLKNLEESMGCNTIRDDHGGGVIYQRVHMNKAAFDEMLGKVEEEYSGLQAENAKLRELLKNALTYIEYEGCGVECPETGHGATLTTCDMCNRYETECCAYVIEQDARELGIEVESHVND